MIMLNNSFSLFVKKTTVKRVKLKKKLRKTRGKKADNRLTFVIHFFVHARTVFLIVLYKKKKIMRISVILLNNII